MKIKLQGDKSISIPEDCRVIIEDGNIIFEKKEQKFKDGDILCSTHSDVVVIFKKYDETYDKIFYSYYHTSIGNEDGWFSKYFRYATEEEKQLLFDKMKEQKLKWNAEEKRVETIRWRALTYHEYYYVNTKGNISTEREENHIFDIKKYEFGNYFHTKEQAKEAAKRVKEVLLKYHEELGE